MGSYTDLQANVYADWTSTALLARSGCSLRVDCALHAMRLWSSLRREVGASIHGIPQLPSTSRCTHPYLLCSPFTHPFHLCVHRVCRQLVPCVVPCDRCLVNKTPLWHTCTSLLSLHPGLNKPTDCESRFPQPPSLSAFVD